jgi:carboxymethylenebutenolidase
MIGLSKVTPPLSRRGFMSSSAAAAADKTADFHEYPGAPHGFVADYRPSYRKDAAEDAWNKMTAWFKKYGALS